MKKIKVKFVGFWDGWNPHDNFIINTIKRKYDVELSDNPDYLFSSCFSDEYMDYDCVRIFFTGENMCPDFNHFDYAIGFEHLCFGDRYLRFPLYLVPELYGKDYELMVNKHFRTDELLVCKKDFCSFVVSNGSESSNAIRKDFFEKLSEYKRVDSGGRYLNNIGIPQGVEDKLTFQMSHKFSIAFENSSHPGYTTEKIVQAFAAGTIPIYWGDTRIAEEFNNKAFINCGEFESFDNVVEYIKRIDEDFELYKSILEEPALVNPHQKEVYFRDLDKFLDSIVSQNVKDAIRTNRLRYGEKYFSALKKRCNDDNDETGRLVSMAKGISKAYWNVRNLLRSKTR